MLSRAATWTIAIISILSRSALSTIVALLLWSVLPNLVGFQTSTVMSGSMEPRMMVGDAIVVRHIDAGQLSPGQILLFDDPDQPGRLRMHRLLTVRQDGRLTTKGDANAGEDTSPVDFDAVHGAAFLRIPYAGLPNYWLRTDQPLPLVAGGALVVLLLAGVRLGRLLEDEKERERRRHRGVRLPGMHRAATAGAMLLVLGSGALAPAAQAHAAYSGTTTNAGNSWATACADRTPTGLGASPQLYWGFGSGSGRDVTDLSGQGDLGTAPTGADVTALTCTDGATPAVQVGMNGGKGLVVEKASHAFPGAMTLAMWFKTSVKGGVLADFGSSNLTSTPSGANGIDRALYLQADGNLSFGADTLSVLGVLSSPMFCTSSKAGGYADNSWHMVVVTYSNTTGCTMNVDSDPVVTQAPPALGLQLLSGYSGYWRFGYDAVTASNGWTGATAQQAFQGSIDEAQVYNAVLDAVSRPAILARGH